MRQTIIPAQITTIEDKIAGNLSLTQILLLMAPLFWMAMVYGILPPQMQFSLYKYPLIGVVSLGLLFLALRIKGKVVLHWLITMARFNLRPQYYLFAKQDIFLRPFDLANSPLAEKKALNPAKKLKPHPQTSLSEHALIQQFLHNPNLSFKVKPGKGGFHVAFEQVRA